ncbi:MAG: hypothetical protein OXG15_07075, partial [Gammaproteobacteria bacterium]|nr:hypothetical protein [Gammaproteobacteria bacterium]
NKLFAEATPIRQFELVISWFFSIKERIGICDHLWQVEMAYRHSNKEPPQSLARLFAEIQSSRANNDK